MSTDDSLPERLGGYRLESSLGRGGMGEVFLAWDERLERHVAVKRILPEPPPGEQARERFRREARAAARLSHPAIVQVFDLLETDHGDCLVMEHVEGFDLTELIAGGELDLDTILRLGAEIADGLAEAHARGLVHRDLKPENVRVTRSGRRAKILDFGLARLLWTEELGGETRDETLTRAASLTEAGALMGTVHAMSPEQAGGRPVDHRSDLFAFGGLLYEMLTGRAPFRGANLLDTLARITGEEPAPLTELRPDLPPELVELIERLLAKAPEDRPANARVVAEALERLRAERLSGQAAPAAPAPPRSAELADDSDLPTGRWPAVPASGTRARPRSRWAAGLVVTLLLAAVAVAVTLSRRSPDPTLEPPIAAESGRSKVALFRFRNLNADPDVDWLRNGLTEMLAVDLSQSPEIDVLALRRLDRILRDLGLEDEELEAPDLTPEMAARTGIDKVLDGSFVRAGEDLRIYFEVRQAKTGEILVGDQRQGELESSLFAMIDGLSSTIRRRLEVSENAERAASVLEVTTSSLQAWRFFTEGSKLLHQSKEQEALPLLERAVSLDPEFALALATLGMAHGALGDAGRAREYTRRALEHADNLPIQQRYFVEGRYYSDTWRSFGRAITAFRRGLELFPEEQFLRSHLAQLYAFHERYREAIREYEVMIRQGNDFAPTYFSLASAQAALGDFESGNRLLTEYTRRNPDSWFGHIGLGWHLTQWGRLEEALEPLQRASELRPGEFIVHNGWWRWSILRQDWERAAREAQAMAMLEDSHARWRGLVCAARTDLYAGRSRRALERFEESTEAYAEPGPFTALSHCWMARLLLQKNLPAQALAKAELAQQQAPGEWPELEGMFLAALAQQALGRAAEADRLAAALDERAAADPNAVEERQLHHLAGRLALARGDLGRAVSELEEAVALLPPRGVPFHWHALPDHVPLWYALGEAELARGRPAVALEWFRKVAESDGEHIEFPALFVRSLSRLAEIHQRLGERAAAGATYER